MAEQEFGTPPKQQQQQQHDFAVKGLSFAPLAPNLSDLSSVFPDCCFPPFLML